MCKTYQKVSVFLAENQRFEASDRDSGSSRMARSTGAYAGHSAVMVNFQDGFNAVLHTPATFVQGCESNQTSASDPHGSFATAKMAAAAADVTVLAVGLTANVMDAHGVDPDFIAPGFHHYWDLR